MKKLALSLLVASSFGIQTLAHAGTPCQNEAKSVVAAIAKVSFPDSSFATGGYAPVIRSFTASEANPGDLTFVIDMQKANGEILNGSHGGSSAYAISISQNEGLNGAKICFVNSVQYTDEP